jgi:hypothetical protein
VDLPGVGSLFCLFLPRFKDWLKQPILLRRKWLLVVAPLSQNDILLRDSIQPNPIFEGCILGKHHRESFPVGGELKWNDGDLMAWKAGRVWGELWATLDMG